MQSPNLPPRLLSPVKSSFKPDARPNPVFKLSNGASLRFSVISKRDSHPLRTYDPSALKPRDSDCVLALTSARHGSDWYSPASEFQVLCADFDKLPPGFDTGNANSDWRPYRTWLKRLFRGRGIVTSSRSGRAKVFFVVRVSDENGKPTAAAGIDALSRILPEYLLPYVDLSHAGLFTTFLTPSMSKALRLGLPSLRPAGDMEYLVPMSLRQGTESDEGYKANEKHLRIYGGEIPAELRFLIGKRKDTAPRREKFLRILLATPSLLSRGFDLPGPKLAAETGLDLEVVYKIRKQLVGAGQLVCIDDGYRVGGKAHTFLAAGALAEALRQIHGDAMNDEACEALPASIKAGEWHPELWKASYRFRHQPEAFLEWVQTLPGHDRKDRFRMAEKAIAMRLRYEERLQTQAKLEKPAA